MILISKWPSHLMKMSLIIRDKILFRYLCAASVNKTIGGKFAVDQLSPRLRNTTGDLLSGLESGKDISGNVNNVCIIFIYIYIRCGVNIHFGRLLRIRVQQLNTITLHQDGWFTIENLYRMMFVVKRCCRNKTTQTTRQRGDCCLL